MKFLCAGTLVLVLAATASAASKPDNWIELRSEHFHVISNAKPREAQEATQRLEELRHFFSLMFPNLPLDPPAPARLVLFKNTKSFSPYKPLTAKGKTDRLGGFMQAGSERMYLALDWSAQDAERTLYHEYVHLLLHLSLGVVPAWLNEGMAELYEQTEINGLDYKLGRYDPGWWELLQRTKLIPLETLLQLDYHRQRFENEEQRALFYAESWALVHFLVVADKGKRGSQFARFLQLFLSRTEQETAFREAFGTDYRGMQKQLEEYLRRDSVTYFYGKMPRRAERVQVDFSPLDPAAAQAYLSDLWLGRGEVAKAEEALQPLAASGNAPPEVRERLGRIALLQGRPEDAEPHLKAALEAQPNDIGLRYYAAWAISHGRLQRAATPQERNAAVEQIVQLLTPVIEAPNPFPHAQYLLLQARLQRNDPPAELIPLVEQARARTPQSREFNLLLAHLYEREQRWEEAEKLLLEAAERATEPGERRRAEEMLDYLRQRREQMARPQELIRVEMEEGAPASTGPRVNVRDPVVPAPAAAPTSAPEVRYVRGTLVDVRCPDDSDSAVVTISAERMPGEAARVVHLQVRSRARLIVLDPTNSGRRLECGPAEAPVAVNYRLEALGETVSGVVMTIEFDPPPLPR